MNKAKLIFIILGCLSIGIIIGNSITGNDTINATKDELIIKQREFIDTLCNHLTTDYECETLLDSEILHEIHNLENKLQNN